MYMVGVRINLIGDFGFDGGNEGGIFDVCGHIYMCMINHGMSGWLFIFIICKYGEMFVGVGILVTFPAAAYLL